MAEQRIPRIYSGRAHHRRSHYTGLTWLVAGALVWFAAWFIWTLPMLAVNGGVALIILGCWAAARLVKGRR